MQAHSILVYSVSNSNIDFYKRCLSNLNCRTFFVSSYKLYEYYLQNDKIDLIVLDLELDSTDALTVIKETRLLQLETFPLIMVCSSKTEDFVQVTAFDSGADAFAELPQSPVVFEARLRALLRRSGVAGKAQKPYLYIDYEQYKIIVGKKAYTLPRLEFKLVDLLFSHPNKIFSKDEIAAQVWHNKEVSAKRTIDIHIRNIRRELGNDIIKTYRGLGYSIKSAD